MIIFLFGYSGSGKSYFSDLLEQQGYKVIRTSSIVRKHGVQQTLENCQPVLDEIIDIIMNTESNVVIDGIRQFDLYEKLTEQVKEPSVKIFIDNYLCIQNILSREGMTYEDAFNKLFLDHELGIAKLRQVSDSVYEATHDRPSNEKLLNYINEVVKENE